MILTDTHCHLDMERFDADRASVIERAFAAGINRMLVPSVDIDSAERIVLLADRHPGLYAAIGSHPTESLTLENAEIGALRRLASRPKVVAIGEIGLDYYWVTDEPRRRKQLQALRAQLDCAGAWGLPAVLHLREQNDADHGSCTDHMLRILGDWAAQLRSGGSPLADRCGVLHSFAGTLEAATSFIDLGFYIGITGPITYPAAQHRREVLRHLPLKRLLIETDSPFLAPQQHRGQRNEPAYVVHIADRIAEIQTRTPSEVAKATSENAARLFAWGAPD